MVELGERHMMGFTVSVSVTLYMFYISHNKKFKKKKRNHLTGYSYFCSCPSIVRSFFTYF